MPFFIDTHAHLYSDEFKHNRREMLERAVQNKVSHIFLPNINAQSVEGLYYLASEFPNLCYATAGIHPCYIQKNNFEFELKCVETELENNGKNGRPTLYAVGETGLDYHWDLDYIPQQKEALNIQVQWAKKYDLPIILHTRKSFADTLQIIENHNDTTWCGGVFHCFSGNVQEAQQVIALGNFYMGIGGVVTYRNSGLDTVIKAIDLKHIVLETDSPYLSPEPRRKHCNESSNIPIIAQKIADIKQVSIETVAEITSQNALNLFKIKTPAL